MTHAKWLIARITCALMIALFGIVAASADELSDFYKGKYVKLVVGYPPSSGYNPYAQILAHHMGDHIPGKPTVVPQNMPGAGSMNAANWLYNVAPRDGTTIGIFAINVTIDALFGGSAANFDPVKFNWIGNMAQTVAICGVWHTSKIRTFEDLRKHETLFGASGPSGGTAQYALAVKHLFGAKIKLVFGYKAGDDILLAMERGEVQGRCDTPLAGIEDRIKAGDVIPLINDSASKVPELPGVPSVYDYAKNESDRQVLDLVFGWHALGRPVAAPPDVPANRLKALQEAFDATMKDPGFLADAKKSGLEIKPESGPAVAVMVRRFLTYPKATVERAADAVRQK